MIKHRRSIARIVAGKRLWVRMQRKVQISRRCGRYAVFTWVPHRRRTRSMVVRSQCPQPQEAVCATTCFLLAFRCKIVGRGRCSILERRKISCRRSFFGQLFHQPELRAPGAMRILVGNGAALDLRGWTTLVVAIDGHWLYHEFGVVGDMPLDAVVGAEIMKSHAFQLRYSPDGPNVIELSNPSCALCEAGREMLLKAQSPQLKFMDPVPKFGRLRQKDVHEAPIMASCSKLTSVVSPSDIYLDNSHVPAREQLTMRERPPRRGPDLANDRWDIELPYEGVEPSVQRESFAQKLSSAIRVLKTEEAFTLESLSVPLAPADNGAVLQKVLAELKISELPIPKEDVRGMVEIVRKHLKAYVVSPTDVGLPIWRRIEST